MRIFFLLVFCLSSCSLSLRPQREVEVAISSLHPWEEATHTRLSYRLVTSSGEMIRLDGGRRSTTITVPRGETALVAAYPLESQFPFTAVVMPDKKSITLTQKQSRLIDGMLSVWDGKGENLRYLNWPVVEAMVDSYGDTLAVSSTIAAIINGTLSTGTVSKSGRVEHTVSSIPSGRWCSEKEGEGSFWYDGLNGVSISLTEGVTCYYCVERGILLRFFVQDGKVSQYLQSFPLWF